MTDEKFTFIQDVRDKKKTATGAHHRRTHCGKGGAVRFPSDFKTKKELRAMNGEVKSYRLNDPVSWAKFKAWPDDIKRDYITALRKKYNVSDTEIAKMMGVGPGPVSKETKRLGISTGQRSGRTKWDKDGWYAWVNGVPLKAEEETTERCIPPAPGEFPGPVVNLAAPEEEVAERFREWGGAKILTPRRGQMELQGRAGDALETIKRVLGDAEVSLTVFWQTTT